MSKLKKVTVSVSVNKVKYIEVLMDKIKFDEIDRVATGGYMSEERLIITFQGYQKDYDPNYYVEVEDGKNNENIYYSIDCPDGARGWNRFMNNIKRLKKDEFKIDHL